MPDDAAAQRWRKDAENHLARMRVLATTTAFGSIDVSVPGSLREWVPANDAARAAVEGTPSAGPAGEVPMFIQFTRFGIKGLQVSHGRGAYEWKPDPRRSASGPAHPTHWVFPEVVGIEQLRAAFTLRLGDDRGLLPSPRIDLEVRIKDPRIPIDVHALSQTFLDSNPAPRRGEFRPGRVTLESNDVPLPGKVQRWLSESFMAQVGETVVADLPIALFALPPLQEPGRKGSSASD